MKREESHRIEVINLFGRYLCFVSFRVISWIVGYVSERTVHQITRNDTKQTKLRVQGFGLGSVMDR